MTQLPMAVLELLTEGDRQVVTDEFACRDSTDGKTGVPKTSNTSWDTSTMCLRTIQRALSAQRDKDRQPDIPMHDGDADPLPRRSLDLGVGWWR